MIKISHSVILNITPNSYFWNLFEETGNVVSLEDGKDAICLFCSVLDLSLPNYLHVVVHKSSNVTDINADMSQGQEMSLPHNLILAIDHYHFAQNQIGFET